MSDPVQLGPFSVGEQIGEGGMGSVYRGTHRTTGIPVALKVIKRLSSERHRRRFHREVQAHAGLLHPGIVYLFEYGEIDEHTSETSDASLRQGSPFVAMELADRGTVRDLMPMARWRPVCRLLVQILDALAYAHARGVIHRDLKPENLLLFDAGESGDDWRVKLTDFGIAHAFAREEGTETTDLHVGAGTPLYMPPEQTRGRTREFGPWTDLYVVGCIAWELVCGRPPFQADSSLKIAMRHQQDDRPPLAPRFPVPDELESWIHRAMAIDPDRRFRRAADAVWALPRSILAETSSTPESAAEPDRSPPNRTLSQWQTRPVTLTQTIDLETGELVTTDTGMDRTGGSAEHLTSDQKTDLTDRALVEFNPPVPANFEPEQTDPLPAPLVGAGLGLFGLRDPPFVDRTDECNLIWDTLHRVVEDGSCELVFAAGEAGTGKSRLAEWMSTRAHEVGAARILRAVHSPGGGPHEGLRGALERTLRTRKMARGEVHEHLLDHLPGLRDDDEQTRQRDTRALTEYLRPADREAEAVDGPPYRFADADQRRALIVRVLERLAARRPLLLWLDDLQWGPDAVGVLEYLSEMPGKPPRILVLATLRSDILAEKPQLHQRLERLQSREHAHALRLAPLSKRHQRELLDGLVPLDEQLADRLAERTEGHPLFAMQLLGHWIERGDIEAGTEGFQIPDSRRVELPEDIHSLWIERIDRLCLVYPAQIRDRVLEVLELAAALGRTVDEREWETLLDETGFERPPDLIDRLVEQGLGERTVDGWAFTHGLLVDSLARRARRAGRWARHHRRCARTLQSLFETAKPGPRERIANHWIEAGEPDEALAPLFEEAELYGRRDEDAARRRLLERRARLLDELDVPERDRRRLEQRIEFASLEAAEGDLATARELATEVWDILETDQVRLRAKCAYALALIEEQFGDEFAIEWAERALRASRQSETERMLSRCHRRLAWNYMYRAEFADAERHTERAIERAEQIGDRHAILTNRGLRAWIWHARDDERAVDLFETLLGEAEAAGYVAMAAQAANGLGDRARMAGRFREAREYYLDCLQKTKELSRPIARATVHGNLAQLELRMRRLERVSDHLRSIEQLLEGTGVESEWEDLLSLLRLAHAAGRRQRSRFATLWSRLDDGWPDDWRLLRDRPWLLETVAELAGEAGWEEWETEVWELARDLWQRLGDEEAAARVDKKLAGR